MSTPLRDLLAMADTNIADFDDLVERGTGGHPSPDHLRDQATIRCLYVIAECLVQLTEGEVA